MILYTMFIVCVTCLLQWNNRDRHSQAQTTFSAGKVSPNRNNSNLYMKTDISKYLRANFSLPIWSYIFPIYIKQERAMSTLVFDGLS